MVKTKIIYSCQHCGAQFSKWQGQCSDCAKWNTISEEVAVTQPQHARVTGYSEAAGFLVRAAVIKYRVLLSRHYIDQ